MTVPSPIGERTAEVDRSRFWRDARRRRMLAFADVIAAAAASIVIASSTSHAFYALVLLPGWVLIAKLIGLYDRDHVAIRHLTIDEAPAIAAWAGIGIGALALILPQTPAGSIGPGALAVGFGVAFGGALVLRSIARWLWRITTPREVTAVIGVGDLAQMIRRKLELFPDMHLELVDDAGNQPFEDLVSQVDRVILASDSIEPAEVGGLVAVCRERQVK